MQPLDPALVARFAASMRMCLEDRPVEHVGIALSGGGDSTALLLLLVDWSRRRNRRISAVTIDHGLRPAARLEAEAAAELCRSVGVGHETLKWKGYSGAGNLQNAARRARHALIARWAEAQEIATVALGHTMDDQAETVLMRLLRGSGVDGLSAMADRRALSGIEWIRPLLGFERDELRDFLIGNGVNWSDDPSNEDKRFDRVKTRNIMKTLGELGLTREGLVKTAANMRSARRVLEVEAQKAARAIARVTRAGEVELDKRGYAGLMPETRFRVMSHSLQWVACAPYRARQSAVYEVIAAIKDKRKTTLAGCLVVPERAGIIRIGREPAAVAGASCAPGENWDGRFVLSSGDNASDCHISALGEKGVRGLKNWRAAGLTRPTLLAAPAVWRGDELIACPLARWPEGWTQRALRENDHYFTSILSH